MLSQNPAIVLFYFAAIPLTAFLAGVFGKGEGHLTPWRELYCFLSYATALPAIFALTLNVYLFLFEKQPIMETNLYTQVLPILIFIGTFFLIRRNVPVELIPGFDKLSGLVMIIFPILAVMWLLDRFRIIAFTYMPFHYVIIGLIVAFILMRFGVKRFLTSSKEA